MAYARGQKVSSAFWSGFVASGFAAPKSMGFYKGTMIMAVASGTTSRLTGGKFANGAVTGAFVHMFNAMYDVMNSNLPRAMSSSGKAGISDRQVEFNDTVSEWIAGIGSFISHAVIYGVEKTLEIIFTGIVNYQRLSQDVPKNIISGRGRSALTVNKIIEKNRSKFNWQIIKNITKLVK